MELEELYQKYFNEHSKWVEIGGQEIHYRIEGNPTGETLFLIHGVFSSLHTWDKWVELLKDEFRIVRCDLPGFGLTGPRKDNVYSVASYITFLKEFLDKLNIDKCHFIGNSLGGWLSWEFAYRYPQKVSRLVLIDAAGFNDRESIPTIFRLAKNIPLKNLISQVAEQITPPKNLVEIMIKNAYGDNNKVTEEITERYRDLLMFKGNREVFLTLANAKVEDNSYRVKEIENPTLIMWGEKDKWIPLANAYKFNYNLVNSKILIYEGVGHIPMEEIPERTAEDAKIFLKDDTLLRNIHIRTSDLCDDFSEKLTVVEPIFKAFGKKKSFFGEIITIKVFEDNGLLWNILAENGDGKVLVVDGGNSIKYALIGEKLAGIAIENHWAGIIINGCVRDTIALNNLNISIRSTNTCPMPSKIEGEGEKGINLNFGGVIFKQGHFLYADEDGIVISKEQLVR
jgi:RraA family protein